MSFESTDQIVVIGSTNFPKSLDKAVIRAGRFDQTIQIPEPSFDSRKKLLQYYLGKLKIKTKEIDIVKIAKLTGGFTGADIKNLVNSAAINVVNLQKGIIEQTDLNESFERMQMGLKRSKEINNPSDLLRTAYHESGHALTGLLTDGSMTLNKMTILPVGQALGLFNQFYWISSRCLRNFSHSKKFDCDC